MNGTIKPTPAGYYIDIHWQGERAKIRNHGKAFKTEFGVNRALSRIRDEIDNGEFDLTYWAPSQRKKHLVKNLTEKWITSQVFRPATIRQKREAISKCIIPNWGNRDIRKLRRHHYMDVFREMPANYMTRKTISQTQAFLRWAYREEILDRPVFLDRPKVGGKEKKWLTPEQQEQVFKHLPTHYHPIIRFIVTYGCRFGEATGLLWDCVDFKRSWISVRRAYSDNILTDLPKEGKEKGLPMTRDIKLILQKLYLKSKHDHVFVNLWGNHYTTALSHAWLKAARKAGFDNCPLHSNRHSFITQRAGNFSYNDIALVTGQNVKTTEGYSHQDADRLLKVVEN